MFDDDHVVANAGLALAGLLSEKLGLESLCDETISIVPFPGRRAATLVHSLVVGGTCIDDADVLRAGSTASVLSHRVMAPSTLGTFLRGCTFGHGMCGTAFGSRASFLAMAVFMAVAVALTQILARVFG